MHPGAGGQLAESVRLCLSGWWLEDCTGIRTGGLLNAVLQIPIFTLNSLSLFPASMSGIKRGSRVATVPGCHFNLPCTKGIIAVPGD